MGYKTDMPASAALAMWWDVPPEMQAEFEDWHTHEHMPERLRIPGFLRGTRWIASSGAPPSYFVLYEAASLETLTGAAYLERLNNPTPWSRKMMPHHRSMVRSVCRVRSAFGCGIAHALATLRFSPAPGALEALAALLPGLPRRRGIGTAKLLQSEPMGSTRTIEQEIRGNDAAADWAVLIGGYEMEAVRSAAQTGPLASMLPGAVYGLYRMAYSLAANELPE